tara:strand:+ start:1026 stop:1202 length:177 start_codon:yes stop_codon:yes gene_type:complete
MGFGDMLTDVYECENQYDSIRHILVTYLPGFYLDDYDNEIGYFYGNEDDSFESNKDSY